MLKHDADKDAKTTEGFRPLQMAIRNGHIDAMFALLQCGADDKAKNNNGHTPLITSRLTGQLACGELLISYQEILKEFGYEDNASAPKKIRKAAIKKVKEKHSINLKACQVCSIKENTKLCSACKTVYYCGVDCQREDWKNHKSQCKKK